MNPWLVVSIALAALLVALGSGCSSDGEEGSASDGEEASALVDDATALIDEINAAITAGDREALETLYTTDATIIEQGYPPFTGTEGIRAQAPEVAGAKTIERTAPVSAYEDFAMTFNVVDFAGTQDERWLTIYQIEDGKVAAQWIYTLPFTP